MTLLARLSTDTLFLTLLNLFKAILQNCDLASLAWNYWNSFNGSKLLVRGSGIWPKVHETIDFLLCSLGSGTDSSGLRGWVHFMMPGGSFIGDSFQK